MMILSSTIPQYKNPYKRWGNIIFFIFLLLAMPSCTSTRGLSKEEIHSLAKASIRLGIDIDRKDNHKLMIEASKWIGVPYRYGGTTTKGIDCSGLTCQIYKNAFGIELTRNSQQQLNKDVNKKIKKNKLEQGDLVFFSPSKSKRKINHVGIYLKEGKFIHSSSSKGVRIDFINDDYWKRQWVTGGRIKSIR